MAQQQISATQSTVSMSVPMDADRGRRPTAAPWMNIRQHRRAQAAAGGHPQTSTPEEHEHVRNAFLSVLHNAITDGQVVPPDVRLRPNTTCALHLIARDHPEASIGQILGAFDAFRREHGDRS